MDREYKIRQSIAAYKATPSEVYEKPIGFHDVVLNAIEGVLVFDRKNPEGWFGNAVSGQHHVELMGEILRKPAEVVCLYANLLELEGRIDFDGENLRLAA